MTNLCRSKLCALRLRFQAQINSGKHAMRKLLTLSAVLGAAVAAILSPGLAQAPNIFSTDNIVTYLGRQTFSDVVGKVTHQIGTTYTLMISDCGTEVAFTNASAVTVTIPANLFVGCNIAIYQAGAGQVAMTGSAVTPATRVSAHSYSKTFGQGAIIGINVPAVGTAVITGDGA